MGPVPRQASTGGKPKLLGISKRGDGYLRWLLIHGARAAVRAARRRPDVPGNQRILKLCAGRRPNVAAMALANHSVRRAWAMLASGESYRPPGGSRRRRQGDPYYSDPQAVLTDKRNDGEQVEPTP